MNKNLLLLCAFLGLICAGDCCSTGNVTHCMEPLNQYQLVDGTGILADVTVETMKEICRKFGQVKDCLLTLEPNCTMNDPAVSMINGSFTYLCDQHFSEYERYRDCIVNFDLREEAHFACSETLQISLNTSHPPEERCYQAKTYLNCMEDVVRAYCGRDAASWQRGFNEASLQHLVSTSDCQSLPVEQPEPTECRLSHCYKALEKYNLPDNSSIFALPSNISKPLCESYKMELLPCIAAISDVCSPLNKLHIKGHRGFFNHLCKDQSSEFERHRECLANPQLMEEGRTCNFSAVYGVGKTVPPSYCQTVNTFIDCVEKLITSYCGEEAASWHTEAEEARLQPLLDSINCQVVNKGNNQKHLELLMLFSAVTALALLFAI